MKGNVMMRLIALMILVPMALAHFTGQVDLTQPSWLWLTLLAGANALQSTFTGWCPPAKFFGNSSSTGSCCTPKSDCCADEKQSSCCSTETKNSCCEGESKSKESCCSDKSDESCCNGESKKEACCSSEAENSGSSCCSGDNATGISGSGCCGSDKTNVDSSSSTSTVVKVLGSGCANCDATAKLITQVADELGIEIEVVKVEDFAEIAAYGVMSTPAVVIGEQVVHFGSVPSKEAIVKWFQ